MTIKLAEYYEKECDEESRLTKDKSHQIEYLTTVKYFDQLIPKNSTILDACAGTGHYAFYLARKGHLVFAGDLVQSNIDKIYLKQNTEPILKDIYTGSILNLTRYKEAQFDVVLCMGAIYHLQKMEERKKAIIECKRVLKSNGLLVVAYTNKIATALDICENNLTNVDSILAFHSSGNIAQFHGTTPEEIEELLEKCGITKICNIGTDGLSFLIKKKINNASDANYRKWLEYHWSICEESSILGYSLHGLFFGKKG